MIPVVEIVVGILPPLLYHHRNADKQKASVLAFATLRAGAERRYKTNQRRASLTLHVHGTCLGELVLVGVESGAIDVVMHLYAAIR